VIEDRPESRQAPVVHVGRGQGDVAERGNLEAASIAAPPGRFLESRIETVGAEAVVQEAGARRALERRVVNHSGERHTAVAFGAAAPLREEQAHAAARLG
jgi:hypothetical protein